MSEISIDKLIKDLNLEIICKPKEVSISITKSDLNRPGLQLAGYFDHFAYERIQILGNVEWNYLNTLEDDLKIERLSKFFEKEIPALILTRNLDLMPQMEECAKKYNRLILRSNLPTTKFVNKIINYLDEMLAPKTTLHGVLVDVYGIGVLITGKSGVGKSETALELVKRGHRLVADDAVEINNVDNEHLIGRAPELIRHFLEIRGIGILDIKRLYGVGAIRNSKGIDIVIELEYWDESKEYDRVGLDEEYTDILGVKIVKLVVPVKPGRNLAMIVEVAARNHRQKQLGYNAAEELNSRLMNRFSEDTINSKE